MELIESQKYSGSSIEKMFIQMQENYSKRLKDVLDKVHRSQMDQIKQQTAKLQKTILEQVSQDGLMEQLMEEFKAIFKVDDMIDKAKLMLQDDSQQSLDSFIMEVDRFKNLNHYEIDDMRDRLNDKPRIQEMIEKVENNIARFMDDSLKKIQELDLGLKQQI